MNYKIPLSAFAALIGLLPVAYSQSANWVGGTSGDWSTTANWSTGTTAPLLDTNVATFNAGSSNTTITAPTNIASVGLVFATGSGAYTINGGTWSAVSGWVANLQAGATQSQVFNPTVLSLGVGTGAFANLTFTNNSTTPGTSLTIGTDSTSIIRNSGTSSAGLAEIRVSGGVSTRSAYTGPTTVIINSTIADSLSGTPTRLTKTGGSGANGTLVLNGPNTFSGGVDTGNASGRIILGNDSALGTGTVRNSAGGTGIIFEANKAVVIANNFEMTGMNGSAAINTKTLTASAASGATTISVSTTGLYVGQVITGTGFAAGTTIASIGAGTIDISTPTTATLTTTSTFSELSVLGSGATAGDTTITVNNVSNLAVGQVIQASNGLAQNTRVVSIAGNVVTLDKPVAATIAPNATVAVSSAPAGSSGLVAFTGSNNITLTGQFNTSPTLASAGANNTTFLVTNTGKTEISGKITQSNTSFSGADITATNNGGIIKTGSGNLTLSGANDYRGATLVRDGTLFVNGDQSLATGAVTVSTLASSTKTTTAATAAGLGNVTIPNTTGLVAGQTVTSSSGSIPVGTFAPNPSTSLLLSNNTTGVTAIGDVITFGQQVGVLAGSGTVGGNTTINGVSGLNAFLKPGATAGSKGLLSFNQALTLGANSTTEMELGGVATGNRGTGYDAINAVGNVAFNGTLSLVMTTDLMAGVFDLFQITGAGTASGAFTSVVLSGLGYTGSFTPGGSVDSRGQTFTYALDGTGKIGQLTVTGIASPIPEASTYAVLAGLTGLAFAGFRRRRQS
jgi:fibronectin-binding autotransporter adhesin